MVKENEKSREKQFQYRESLLTYVLRDKHSKAIYNFVITFLVIITLQAVIKDIYYDGRSNFGFYIIQTGFRGMGSGIKIWITVFTIHLLVYFGFNIWALLIQKYKARKLITFPFLLSAVCIYLGIMQFTGYYCRSQNLPVPTATVLLLETWHFVMKGYAFLRYNSGRVWKGETNRTTFTKYLYFSRVPTYIYKDEYPRTQSINWTKVLKHIAEFILTVYFVAILEQKYVLTTLEDFGKSPFTLVDTFYYFSNAAIASFACFFLVVQIAILHSYQNIAAELLTYGDRQFYGDWWTKSDIADYFTSWNKLIQEWLYFYIYRDFYEAITPKNKLVSTLAVLIVSSALHEFVFYYATGMFFPMFSLLYAIGGLSTLFRTKSEHLNVFLIWQCVLGHAVIWSLPHLEYFARINCPDKNVDFNLSKLYSCMK